jgi:hypothetical protein
VQDRADNFSWNLRTPSQADVAALTLINLGPVSKPYYKGNNSSSAKAVVTIPIMMNTCIMYSPLVKNYSMAPEYIRAGFFYLYN